MSAEKNEEVLKEVSRGELDLCLQELGRMQTLRANSKMAGG